MAAEKRAGYLLGITPGEWLGAGFVLVGVVGSYSAYGEKISQAQDAISRETQERKEAVIENRAIMQEMRDEFKEEIQASEQRTRQDIQELRSEIIKVIGRK